MEKKWTVTIIGFFLGMIVSSALLIDYCEVGFNNNLLHYVLILAAILGIIATMISPTIQDSKRSKLAKWVLCLSIPIVLFFIIFKIFFKDILDMNYFSIIGLLGTSIAMILVIRADKKSFHKSK